MMTINDKGWLGWEVEVWLLIRLEKGIREACNSYYAGRVRRLKANKERTTQTVLQVRYNIKLGFFFEVRRDHVAALR